LEAAAAEGHSVNDQRALVRGQYSHFDQVGGWVGTEEQCDGVVSRVGGDGKQVAQGMADVVFGDAWR